jgi:hypothetical protein
LNYKVEQCMILYIITAYIYTGVCNGKVNC